MYSKMGFVSTINFCVLVSMAWTYVAEKSNEKITKARMYRSSICYDIDGKSEDVCTSTLAPNYGHFKCMCDSDCAIYGDCCPESQPKDVKSELKLKGTQKFWCAKKLRFYVINTCPSDYNQLETKLKCERTSSEHNYADMKMMKPVMDMRSGLTYLNAYCAACNGVTDFEKFRSSFNCESSRRLKPFMENSDELAFLKQVLSKVQFNNETELFTAVHNDTAFNCSHSVVTPDHMEPYLRYCEPALISSCPENYDNTEVIEKCHRLYSTVYSNTVRGSGQVYKNIFCAMCHNMTENTDLLHQCQFLIEAEEIPRIGASSMWSLNPTPGAEDVCDDPNLRRFLLC